jgi:predicted PolB exonuclease-like 3'-5' exonuclease
LAIGSDHTLQTGGETMSANAAQIIIVCFAVAAMASCEMVKINHDTATKQVNAEVQKLCVEKGWKYTTDWSDNPKCEAPK